MTDMQHAPLKPWEHRLRAALTDMLDALPADMREELTLLANTDPETHHGLVAVPRADGWVDVLWLGRLVGAVDTAWLFTDSDDVAT
jgi:hypothetical protein